MYLERYLRRLRAPIRRLLPRRGVLAYLAMMGPGFVTANAGNDAGGIATYAQAGAAYGYELLWAMVLTAVALIVVQEMCARMGAITGKGLSDLIREEFGIAWAALAMLGLLVANGTITISEFVGINAATRVIALEPGLHGTALGAALPYIVVVLAAIGLWWLVTRGRRGPVERVLLVMALVFMAYIPAALKAERHWDVVLRALTIVGGKGGVGKSTVATALAIRAADDANKGNHRRVLLVSTDPAPSIADALGERRRCCRSPRPSPSAKSSASRAAWIRRSARRPFLTASLRGSSSWARSWRWRCRPGRWSRCWSTPRPSTASS